MKKKNIFKSFYFDQRAAVAIIAVIVFPVLLGMLGLGIEVGMWYNTKRMMQNAADAAAIGGAIELSKFSTVSTITTRATSDAARNGFTANGSISTVIVNLPPASGPNTSNSSAVEVILTQVQPIYLSALFLHVGPTISVRSVAAGPSVPPPCILMTQNSATMSATNSQITATGCGIAVNGTTSPNITAYSGGTISASYIYTQTATSISGGTITATNGIKTGISVNDQYSGVTIPSYSGCAYTSMSVSGTTTLNPGVYCSGLTINSGANVTMNPGVYTFDQGVFTISGNANVTANGAVLIFTSSTGNNYSYIDISGMTSGGSLTVNSIISGTMNGIAIFGDYNSTHTMTVGSIAPTINGVFYLAGHHPSAGTFNGCMQMVANGMNPTSGSVVINLTQNSTCQYYNAAVSGTGVTLAE